MRVKTFYNDLQPCRVAKKHDLPEFYEESKKLLMDYYNFHCKRVGTQINFAEYFKKMIEFPLSDENFLKEHPEYANESAQRKKKRKKLAKSV